MRYNDYPQLGERLWLERPSLLPELRVLPKSGWNHATALFAAPFGGADLLLPGEEPKPIPAGTAHYLEHKLFDMPEGNASNILTALGAESNAFTTEDMTAYYFSCAENFDECLTELLRFVSTPYFPQESVDRERSIIAQEIRMEQDKPETRAWYGLLRLLFRRSPLREDVAGTEESIAQITPELLEECHRAFYVPGRMALCVVGDVSPEHVAELADKVLPRRPAVRPLPERRTEKPAPPRKKKDKLAMAVGSPLFAIGCRLPVLTGPALLRRRLVAETAVRMLAGESSPTYRKLYEAGLIDSTFDWRVSDLAGETVLTFTGRGRDPGAVLQTLAESAAKLAANPDEGAFRRAVRAGVGNSLRELNSFTDLCYNMAQGCFGGYDPLTAAALLSRLEPGEAAAFLGECVTAEDLAFFAVEPLA